MFTEPSGPSKKKLPFVFASLRYLYRTGSQTLRLAETSIPVKTNSSKPHFIQSLYLIEMFHQFRT